MFERFDPPLIPDPGPDKLAAAKARWAARRCRIVMAASGTSAVVVALVAVLIAPSFGSRHHDQHVTSTGRATTTTTTPPPVPDSGLEPTTTLRAGPLPGVAANCTASPPDNWKLSIRPSAIVVACGDDGQGAQDITWSAWTTASARGAGTVWQNGCIPDCARGKIDHYPALITLTNVQTTIYGPAFSKMTVSYTAATPAGKQMEQLSLETPPNPSPLCMASDLQASVFGQAGAGAYNELYIKLTNVSAHACHMQGYPGFELLDASGTPILNAAHGCPGAMCPSNHEYQALPARSGSSFLSVVWQTPTTSDQACKQSSSVLITPPDTYDHLAMPLQISVCGQPPVAGIGTLSSAV
ncbi:MAG: DUF4232 domain-containing protein [Acidimicrobiia bacterium]|nr:DUF4232 domain-containing protein [Acidimicrobiia bacterium]